MPEPEPELPGGDQEIVCPGRAGVGTVTSQMITSVKIGWDIGRIPRGPAGPTDAHALACFDQRIAALLRESRHARARSRGTQAFNRADDISMRVDYPVL